ncbi:MAG: hypothetical protein DHS20C06_15480 [Hyphobacterium sp.]|nr:MAG: hypothetical protein DHS20C06_15480 [Hyphobacterium sp.]
MKVAIFSLAFAVLASTSAHAQVVGEGVRWCGDYGSPAEDMPEEFGQFAFMIGDFDVQFLDWNVETESWGEPRPYFAHWNGRYGMGGRAIIDEWYAPGFGYRETSGAGVNIRIWDADEGIWKTAWHNTASNQVLDLRQQVLEDGRLHLWQVYPEGSDRNIWFETYENGEWARITQARDEDSGEWVNSVSLYARPADCGTE